MSAAEAPRPGATEGALERALGLGPAEVDLMGELFVEVLRGSGIEAAPIFERLKRGASIGEALAVPPGVARMLYARAHQWFAAGRPDRAEELFRTLCIIDGDSADNWVGWGICLRMADRLDQAVFAFETAARLAPDSAVPPFHALELRLARGELEAARDALARYDARAASGVPDPLRAEAERFRAALALRRQGPGGG